MHLQLGLLLHLIDLKLLLANHQLQVCNLSLSLAEGFGGLQLLGSHRLQFPFGPFSSLFEKVSLFPTIWLLLGLSNRVQISSLLQLQASLKLCDGSLAGKKLLLERVDFLRKNNTVPLIGGLLVLQLRTNVFILKAQL